MILHVLKKMNKKAIITSTTIFIILGIAIVLILLDAAKTYENNATYQNTLISNNMAFLLNEMYNVPGDVSFRYTDTFLSKKSINIFDYKVSVRNNDSYFSKDAYFFGLRNPEISTEFRSSKEKYIIKRGNQIKFENKVNQQESRAELTPTIATKDEIKSIVVSSLSNKVDEELFDFSQSLADFLSISYESKFEETVKTKPSLLIFIQRSENNEIYTNFLDQKSLKLSYILEKKLNLDPEPIEKLENREIFNKAEIVLLIKLNKESFEDYISIQKSILGAINVFNE